MKRAPGSAVLSPTAEHHCPVELLLHGPLVALWENPDSQEAKVTQACPVEYKPARYRAEKESGILPTWGIWAACRGSSNPFSTYLSDELVKGVGRRCARQVSVGVCVVPEAVSHHPSFKSKVAEIGIRESGNQEIASLGLSWLLGGFDKWQGLSFSTKLAVVVSSPCSHPTISLTKLYQEVCKNLLFLLGC